MLFDGALTGLALKARGLLRSLNEPSLAPFLADWPDLPDAPPVGSGPRIPGVESVSTLPVLRCLPEFAADQSGFGAALVADLCLDHQLLMWRQTYAAGDVGDAFMRNYGYAEIVGLKSVPSRRIACGFLILGPSTLYPRHRHEAEEIYIPLRGTARWEQSDAVWRERRPGAVIHHASGEPHSMQTGAEPLLALYIWRSERLNQKARLD
jgi:quercetin dioxygenase-like cupin family protein